MANEICQEKELQFLDLHQVKKTSPIYIKLSSSFIILDVSASLQSLVNIVKANKKQKMKIKDIIGRPLKNLGEFLNQDFLDGQRLIEVLPINSTLKSTMLLNDNHEIMFQWHLMQLTNTDEFNLFGYDITIEDLLFKQLNALSKIISLIPGSFYWKDVKGRYLGCNDNVWKMAHLSSIKDIIGKTDKELPWAYLADEWTEHDKLVLEKNMPLSFQETVVLPSGEKTIHTVIKLPLHDHHGRVIGILGTSLDITEQKKIQKKLIELNRLRSEFISNMEHDIRTPFSGLESSISTLVHQETDKLKKQILECALSSIEEFKVIIESILNFDHKRYGHSILYEPLHLKNIFESVSRLYRPTADTKQLKFSYRIDSTIPRVLISDEWRIKHILVNLVGNALKFTNEGEVFFEATLIRHEDRRVLIEFVVKDTGIGIPDDKREVIFERYVRLEGSNKGRYKGTGLGLANVKDYVDQLDGEFRPVQSEPNKGTTFAILIPMKESLDQTMPLPSDQEKAKEDEIKFFYDPARRPKRPAPIETKKSKTAKEEKVHSPKRPKSTPTPTDKTTTLLIEDSPPAQFMGKIAIQGANCEVDVAGTAEEALKMIEEKDYDLIFADIGLPGMDGIEMTRHLRYNERKQGKRPTPIVGQTANANTKTKKASIEAGMQDLLAKPLTPTNVSEMLKSYTKRGLDEEEPAFIPNEIKSTTIIDHDSLLEVWRDYHSLKKVFDETKKDTIEDVENFKKAYLAKDCKQFLFLTHKIRGAFLYFAAPRVEEAFSHLEDYFNGLKGKQPDLKVVKPMYDVCIAEIDTVLKEVEKLLNNI